jgi:hypothetical protein
MITLDLTNEQAKVLLTVLHRVGGPPSGLRLYCDDIIDMLAEAGIDDAYGSEVIDYTISGQIYFRGSDGSTLDQQIVNMLKSL